jgi:predicted membrane channel-forming protein YqfA (hemolysin III family)
VAVTASLASFTHAPHMSAYCATVPAVFGYHEVFHALVIAAAAVQCAVIAFWVVPH